jgi:hypothetical protein
VAVSFEKNLNYDSPPVDLVRNQTGKELRRSGQEGVYIETAESHRFIPFKPNNLMHTNLTRETVTFGLAIPGTNQIDRSRPTTTYDLNKVDMQIIYTDDALPKTRK